MDKFDRGLQRQLLQVLYEASPNPIEPDVFQKLQDSFGSEDAIAANLLYLEGHDLIVSGIKKGINDYVINLNRLEITAKGIDFIRDDGGLGAIINVLTIQLHGETLDELEKIINSSGSATPEDKKKLLSQLRSLPSDAIKHLTLQLLGKGLEHLPDAFHIIQTALRHL
ncbi:hypothetical protein [Mangrovibacter yixingensis]|uniref:hypothetical protein n=1 Tax=Mangrovibacter yixingensis TaxID=1529639 RepID=UPI001CF95873|nr:hypothetical protein [Mangrovibacter yixingensis]